ncbi:hypothetical protein [Streptomyces sp. NPDC003077]|uniref:hypothetical protein n=1 Tax=Streptomyces sp. NPDC003077 TaxID=3154443 RepID=UPI0033B69FBF
MIRIVTTARLAALQEEAEAVRSERDSALEALDTHWIGYLCSIERLTEERDGAERFARAVLRNGTELLDRVEEATATRAAALLLASLWAARVASLERELETARAALRSASGEL